MTRKEVEETIEKMLEPIAAAHGVRIYDVDYTKEGGEYSLCCYIDKDGGVTIDDCVDVSHDLSDELDRTDPIKDAYTLYVSSPGLGRALTKDRHFAASIGEEVEGTTFQPFLFPEEAALLNKEETLNKKTQQAAGDEEKAPEESDSAISVNKKDPSGKKKKKSGAAKKASHKNFDGVLKAFDGNTVTIGRTDEKGKDLEDLVLNRKDIAKIRLKIDF